MTQKELLKKLQRPKGKIDVVIDTDTFNEIDDQFALAYLVKSSDQLNLQAIYAAPFHNEKSDSPQDGMEKSYREIFNILHLMGENRYDQVIYKGSVNYLPDETEPVDSPAARDLIKRAMEREEDDPLYVLAIGAITNIASALLIEPRIKDKIVIIWLGGHSWEWPDTHEFNMYQDVAAARVVFGSGAPVVQLPCNGVVDHLTTTGPELEYWLRGKNKLCDYLVDITTTEADACHGGKFWSRVIWDVSTVAWLLSEEFMEDRYEHSPIPQYDDHYSFDHNRHFIKYVYAVNRDKIFEDLFTKLAK